MYVILSLQICGNFYSTIQYSTSTIPDLETNKGVVTKTVWYWHKDRQIDI